MNEDDLNEWRKSVRRERFLERLIDYLFIVIGTLGLVTAIYALWSLK